MPTLERRAIAARPQLRATDTGNIAAGYAALFNTPTLIAEAFEETILPGAFADTLRDDDQVFLHSHDTGRVMGRKSAGTLRLTEDGTGLAVEDDLPDTNDGRDLAVQLDRGDIAGMSFGFNVTHDEWDFTVEPPRRSIHAVQLLEVSAVAFPAYPETSLALRSMTEARKLAGRTNSTAAQRRIAQRKAETAMRLRGISPAK